MTPSLISAPRLRSTSTPVIANPGTVTITIEYCELGNYLRPAALLAKGLRRELPGLDLAFDLQPACGGVFEVHVDGRLIFSKRATRRLPDKEEILYHVQVAGDSLKSTIASASH